MNIDRILRDIDGRLQRLSPEERAEVHDVIRQEFARDRRRLDPTLTVENERERRVEAETLREVLEAINRQARLEETIEEVLRQLARLVTFDSCSLGLLEDSRYRIIAVRGFPRPGALVGLGIDAPIIEAVRTSRQTLTVPDTHADQRFVQIADTPEIRSWAGIPLIVEGEVIGVLSLDRHTPSPFDESELRVGRALAFSAAAAIRKAQLLEQVRRYASLMEEVVEVDQAVFLGQPVAAVARRILKGALRVGNHSRGLLLLAETAGHRIAAAVGDGLEELTGQPAPSMLATPGALHLGPEDVASLALELGTPLDPQDLLLVELATPDESIGRLVLFDAEHLTPDDRLVDAFASRAANAYVHAMLDRNPE